VETRDGPNSRIGFIVPKHGHTAVRRNRLKRILRELTRLTVLSALRASSAGLVMDIVMRARPSAYSAPQNALRAEFDRLRARLLRPAVAESCQRTNVTPPVTGS